jgi:hypothetical protein
MRVWVAFGLLAAGSGEAAARCVLPEYVMRDAQRAAEYLLDSEDVVIDGIVRELPRGDQTLFQRLEVRRYLKGSGPMAVDIWPGPGKRSTHTILDTDEWGRIDAPHGARVMTALKRTPFGWTVGECAYQALAVPGVEDALRDAEWVAAFNKRRQAEAEASAKANRAGGE